MLDPCVRSCLVPWSATLFGLLPSVSQSGACQTLSSSSRITSDCSQHAPPTEGDDATSKSFVVLFTDLVAERASEFFGDVLNQLAVPSYVNDGFVMGSFYEGNEGTAIYNASFRPFTSPVPFLLVRQAVVSDWKFFLDNEDWLNRWAGRYRDAGVQALAEELRRLPWRERRD